METLQAIAHRRQTAGHSSEQPLEEHLTATAALAAEFAAEFDAREWGRVAGLLHDVGKYSKAFQGYLRCAGGMEAHLEGQAGRVDHSTAGALHAWRHLRDRNPAAGRILAYCIAGHHAGLADWDGQSNACLRRRLAMEKPEKFDTVSRAAGIERLLRNAVSRSLLRYDDSPLQIIRFFEQNHLLGFPRSGILNATSRVTGSVSCRGSG